MQDQIGETSENHVSPFKTPDYKKKKKGSKFDLCQLHQSENLTWIGS